VDRFRELYPQRGALKWFVNLCLVKFAEIHDHDLDREIGEVVEAANLTRQRFTNHFSAPR